MDELFPGQRAASVALFGQWVGGTLKCQADLYRYQSIIGATRPQVIVEIGTYNGKAADWLAQSGSAVITVDINLPHPGWQPHPNVRTITGDSIRHGTRRAVAELVAGRTCMVILDSDHSTDHVYQEIALYAPLVTPGCHLVVEDGILAWLDEETLRRHTCNYVGNPLEAIHRAILDGLLDDFGRDRYMEFGSPDVTGQGQPTMSPSGWWRRMPDTSNTVVRDA